MTRDVIAMAGHERSEDLAIAYTFAALNGLEGNAWWLDLSMAAVERQVDHGDRDPDEDDKQRAGTAALGQHHTGDRERQSERTQRQLDRRAAPAVVLGARTGPSTRRHVLRDPLIHSGIDRHAGLVEESGDHGGIAFRTKLASSR